MRAKKAAPSPPFVVTPAIVKLVAKICEHIGRAAAHPEYVKALRLNRINRIRSIHGSLAIEGNALDQEQITAILEGKRVIGPKRDILEARNALAAYAKLKKWRPLSEASLLKAHGMLMTGVAHDAGRYRAGNVGVLKGKQVIHMAPPAKRTPLLMRDLFKWLKATDQHPLIASSIFHYEFEFIHPFSDGNGRMGRLWQSALLSKWSPLFEFIPVESLVHANQRAYYQALQQSARATDAAPFVEFMLKMILQAVREPTPQVAPQVTPQVRALLSALKGEMSLAELLGTLRLSDRKSFRERYLRPALKAGLIAMTQPHAPRSSVQRYRLTPQGKRRL